MLLVILGILLVVGLQWPLGRNEWPGWVQAVGSIAAIVAAYFLGAAQVEETIQAGIAAELRAEKKRQASILAIGAAAISMVDGLPDTAYNNKEGHLAIGLTYDTRVFDGLISALGNVPVHELGSAKAVESFFGIKNSLIVLQDRIEKFWILDIPASGTLYPSGTGDEGSALKTAKMKIRMKQFFAVLEAEFLHQ